MVSRLRLLLTAGLLAGGIAAGAHLGGALDVLENASVDKRFEARGATTPSDVAVIAIDDVTFSDLKLQWPFPRHWHGKAIDALRVMEHEQADAHGEDGHQRSRQGEACSRGAPHTSLIGIGPPEA